MTEKQYYLERNGLIKNELDITFKELVEHFSSIYSYFNSQEYFSHAVNGTWEYPYFGEPYQVFPATFTPSAEIYFINHLQSKKIWPILDHCRKYSKDELFTVIEILYDHIAIYDQDSKELKKDGPQAEYIEHINNILRLFDGGFYLEPCNGFVMRMPNQSLKEQLSYKDDEIPDKVYLQLSSASQMYYRFDSDMEMKKKAITILGDIYEYEREKIKDLFNDEFGINKNKHDKLIFGILNECNLRHNKENQNTEYSREIWYDWMMQYYTSAIIAYYRLRSKYEPR